SPRVERLEDRLALAIVGILPRPPLSGRVTAVQSGTLVTVQGSNGSDHITINDHGTTRRLFSPPAIPGVRTLIGAVRGVGTIRLHTKEGDDTVRYNVQGTAPVSTLPARPLDPNVAVVREVDAHLGKGNDRFEMNVVRFVGADPEPDPTPEDLGKGSI